MVALSCYDCNFVKRGCWFGYRRINKGGEPPTVVMDQEKRMRREIANSNERRRMQSINNGFQSLRSLLPHHEGEKLSKVSQLFFTILGTISKGNFLPHENVNKQQLQ